MKPYRMHFFSVWFLSSTVIILGSSNLVMCINSSVHTLVLLGIMICMNAPQFICLFVFIYASSNRHLGFWSYTELIEYTHT